ncbi:MAG: AbrB/MazE/SpoVT family DNA-binding domain-containing protein [Spirochaetia bacterium]|nr:AbrB/MazE/SpoVT family DNA-binding domain-containing protein [Spirochaetia bacterium]
MGVKNESSSKKWGNSIGIRIPATFAHNLGLDIDSIVELLQIEDGIKIVPVQKKRQEKLQELLDQITPDSMHAEDFFGKETGKEQW